MCFWVREGSVVCWHFMASVALGHVHVKDWFIVVATFSKACKEEVFPMNSLLLFLSKFPAARGKKKERCKGKVSWNHRVLPIYESESFTHLLTTTITGQQRQSLKAPLPKHEQTCAGHEPCMVWFLQGRSCTAHLPHHRWWAALVATKKYLHEKRA